MIKFRCGHCGHRIALARRRWNQVAVCPDCRQPTHPIAEQVLKRRQSQPAPLAPANHVCENCNGSIGRLEKRHVWDNHLVCSECHRKLSKQSTPASSVVVPVARKPALPSPDDSQFDPHFVRPFRGGLFGALVGLCVAAAALYGALNLLKDVAGLLTGLAFGGLALLVIYLVVRWMVLPRDGADTETASKRLPIAAPASHRRPS